MHSYSCVLCGPVFVQETSGAYARMSFDLEEVRNVMNHCSDAERVEHLRFIKYL